MNSINKPVRAMLIASLAAVVLSSGSAFAGAVEDFVPSEVVKFQDINLDSQAGVAVLYRRIANASQHVCGVGDSKDLGAMQRSESCAKKSEARAVAQINSHSLTAYYEKKTGQFVATLASR